MVSYILHATISVSYQFVYYTIVSQARPFRFAASICGTRSDTESDRCCGPERVWLARLECTRLELAGSTFGVEKTLKLTVFAWTLCIIIISAVGIMIYISFGGANYLLFPWANTTISSIIPWLGFPCTSIYIIAPELVATRYHDRSQS